ILAANPTIAFKPMFLAIDWREKETVFHQGKESLYISTGLVKRCKTEGELAAVLCLELAKMVAEQEALAAKNRVADDDRAPLAAALARDISGGNLTPDQTEIAEGSKLEAMQPRRRPVLMPQIDPHLLARPYLTKAGFQADDLTKVGSLLQAAELNPQFEQ